MITQNAYVDIEKPSYHLIWLTDIYWIDHIY